MNKIMEQAIAIKDDIVSFIIEEQFMLIQKLVLNYQ